MDQVRETESVKADITRTVWDAQRKWEFKKDTYVKIAAVISDMSVNKMEEAALGRIKEEEGSDLSVAEKLLKLADRTFELNRELHRLRTLAFLVIDPKAWRIVEEVLGETDEDDTPEWITNKMGDFLSLARKDLSYDQR